MMTEWLEFISAVITNHNGLNKYEEQIWAQAHTIKIVYRHRFMLEIEYYLWYSG